jgi:nucleoside-diphosphate kinase
MEQTLVLVKFDGVARGLVGEITSRFEKTGLKIVAAKLTSVSKELAEKHYPADREEFLKGMGNKTLENYAQMEVDPVEKLGTDSPLEIGRMIREWLIGYIQEGPVMAYVLEAPHAVELVRKLCGHTLPLISAPGTIRGDFAFDSSYLANTAGRAIRNMMHASGTVEEAKYEIPLWFKKEEILKYSRTDEKVMTG